MEAIAGLDNSLLDYLAVLASYFLIYIIAQYLFGKNEVHSLSFSLRLFLIWTSSVAIIMFLIRTYSQENPLPILFIIIHSIVWVGLCHSLFFHLFRNSSLRFQFLFFFTISAISKIIEYLFLGIWAFPTDNVWAFTAIYIAGWSLVYGLYPIFSKRLVDGNPTI